MTNATTATALNGVASIRVAPGIGLGRVGNSDEFFIGPETPGVVPDPGGKKYKDAQGRIKRQAQRFRVYGYDANGVLLGEICHGSSVNGQVAKIEWQVHVTNMKSANYAFQGKYAFDPSYLRNSTVQPGLPPAQRSQLIIDPGVKVVSSDNHAPVELIDPIGSKIFDVPGTSQLSAILNFSNPSNPPVSKGLVEVSYTPAVVSLGNISTDTNGRLIFVGGKGESKSCTTPSVVISKTSLPSGVQALENSSPEEKLIQENPEYNLNSYFNNPGWYDDTCGGSINASVVNGQTGGVIFSTDDKAEQRGWVAVAPPHYAPSSNNVVSLLDLQMDIFPEADPYSGKGPFYVAQVSSDNGLQLATLASAPIIDSSPVSLPFVTIPTPFAVDPNFSPAVISFQGNNHIVFVDTNAKPYIGVESSPGIYTFSPVLDASGSDAPSATSSASLAVLNNTLYIAYNSGGIIQLASTSGADFTFTQPTTSPYIIETNQAPALLAFNGVLYVAAADNNNQLLIGNSNENPEGTITLSQANLQSDNGAAPGQGVLSQTIIGLTVYVGAIRLGFVGSSDGLFYIASSTDGNLFNYSKVENGVTATANYGVSLSSFNNKLYYALASSASERQLGVSNDGEHFTFEGLLGSDGVSIPTIFANIPVNFYRDIYPTLKTVTDYAWTNERAFHGHRPGTYGDFLHPTYLPTLASPGKAPQTPDATPAAPNRPSPNITRLFVFNFIRPPSQQVYLNTNNTLTKYEVPPPPAAAVAVSTSFITSETDEIQRADLMPRLFGNGGSPLENSINGSTFPNQWLPLTNHQLEKFQQWVNGNFESGTLGAPPYQDIPEPDQLDFAALQPTVGGGFHPGIELTYLMHEAVFFNSPFRFAQPTVPGSIAAYMSVPWQGDFWSCNVSWWPALRPDIVVERTEDTPPVLTHQQWFRGNLIPPESNSLSDYEGGYDVMVDHWPDFGLVTPVEGVFDRGQQVFAETERNISLDLPSLISSIDVTGQIPSGDSLTLSPSSNIIIETSNVDSTDQHWQLVKSTSSAGYLFIQEAGSNNVLTVDFSSGALSLQAKSPYNEDSQLWQYQATETQAETENALTELVNNIGSATPEPQNNAGYPGHFHLVSKLNLKLLSANADGSVSTASSSNTVRQLWKLDAAQENTMQISYKAGDSIQLQVTQADNILKGYLTENANRREVYSRETDYAITFTDTIDISAALRPSTTGLVMTGMNFGGGGKMKFSLLVNDVSQQTISENLPVNSSQSWAFTFVET